MSTYTMALTDPGPGFGLDLDRWHRLRDRAALERLMSASLDQAYTQARRTLGNAADAQDAVQEAMVQIMRSAHRFDPARPFAPWLARHVHDACCRLRWRARRSKAREQAVARPDEMTPAEGVDAEAVRAAVADLPERDRAAIELHYWAGLPQAEVARELGLSENALAVRLHRVRERLRDLFTRRGVSLGAAGVVAALAPTQAWAAPPALLAGVQGLSTAAAVPATSIPLGVVRETAWAAARHPWWAAAGVAMLLGGTIGLGAALLPSAVPPVPPYAEVQPPVLIPSDNLVDASWEVRLATIKAMALQGGMAIPAERAAVLSADPVWIVREAFIGAIPDLQVPGPAALAATRMGLQDDSWPVRLAAVETAGALGPAATSLVPRLRELSPDKIVGSAAQRALQQIGADPEVPLGDATAARIVVLKRQLGPGWTIDDNGAGLVVASSAKVLPAARRRALDDYVSVRQRYSWLVPLQQPLPRPVTLLLVHGPESPIVDITSADSDTISRCNYEPSSRTCLADVTNPGTITWSLLGWLLKWDGATIPIPPCLQFGMSASLSTIESVLPSGKLIANLRHERMLAWASHMGLHHEKMVDEHASLIPANPPPISLAWLLTLDAQSFQTSNEAPGQFAETLSCALVRYLESENLLEPYYNELRKGLTRHHSRLVRTWAMSVVATRSLTTIAGCPLDELQRRLLTWVRATTRRR